MEHPDRLRVDRLAGLRRFAAAITLLNILGHTVLGFEQSFAQPIVSLLTAYGTELLGETIEARVQGRSPRYRESPRTFLDFLLSAHITGLAVAMLLYFNDELYPVAFASATAVGSKILFRTQTESGSRHFLNPSNFGITITLLLFPWISIAAPYQFAENLSGWGDWLLPAVIITTGTFLNARFTHRIPLIAAWLCGFVLQAAIRSWGFDTPLGAGLMPMTGVAFILFTFYMVTDPATTPSELRQQIWFGAGVAATYGLLLIAHVSFGLFFALTIVCIIRGLALAMQSRMSQAGNMIDDSLQAGKTATLLRTAPL